MPFMMTQFIFESLICGFMVGNRNTEEHIKQVTFFMQSTLQTYTRSGGLGSKENETIVIFVGERIQVVAI